MSLFVGFMIEDMTIHNLSRLTQQSYIYAVAKFGYYFKRSERFMSYITPRWQSDIGTPAPAPSVL